jgi:hemerythrin superfamily protein
MSDTADTPNVIDAIQRDHQQIESLLARVADRNGQDRAAAFDELAALLARHEAAEQAVVRPEIEKIDGTEAEARDSEEMKADAMLERLRAMDIDSSEFDATFGKFRTAVLSHAAHEEAEEHPKLEAGLDPEQLQDMGEEFIQAEEESA